MRYAFVNAWGLALCLYRDLVRVAWINWLLFNVHSLFTLSIINPQLLESQISIVELVLQYNWWIKWNLHPQKFKWSVRQQLENQALWQVVWNLHCKSTIWSRRWPDRSRNVRLRIDVLENNACSESYYSVLFAIDGQIKLGFLWLGSSLEDTNVLCFLFAFILDLCLVQFIIDLEITGR